MPAPPDPTAKRFVMELIGTGLAFTDTLASLIESLEETGQPGEEAAEAVVDMAAGSIHLDLRRRPREEVELTIDLLVTARERLASDLKLAAEISGRRERMRR